METLVKFCTYCNTEHPHTAEYWLPNHGRLAICRVKRTAYVKEYQRLNAKKLSDQKKEYHALNAEKVKACKKAYRDANRDKIRAWQKQDRKDRPEYYRQKSHNDYIKFREKINARVRNKLATDPQYRLAKLLRNRVREQFRAGSTVRDLGCSLAEFKQYIESKFQPGMSWENWNYEGWHLDHIIPLSKFDLTNREQVLKAFHYTNLQPLWARDNLRKNKYVEEK
jgi:hypothetical protein